MSKKAVKGTFLCAQCPRTFDSLDGVRMHVGRVHDMNIRVPNEGKVKSSKKPERLGKPWTKAQHAKFKKTMRAKRNGASISKLHDRIEKINKEPMEDPRDFINCCPHCGTNLQAYYLAAKAARRHA